MPKYVTDSSGIILSLFRLFESIDKKQEPFIKIEKNRLDGILKNLCSVLLEIVLGSTVLVDRSEATIQSVRVIEYLYSHYREPLTLQFLRKNSYAHNISCHRISAKPSEHRRALF